MDDQIGTPTKDETGADELRHWAHGGNVLRVSNRPNSRSMAFYKNKHVITSFLQVNEETRLSHCWCFRQMGIMT